MMVIMTIIMMMAGTTMGTNLISRRVIKTKIIKTKPPAIAGYKNANLWTGRSKKFRYHFGSGFFCFLFSCFNFEIHKGVRFYRNT